MRQFSRSPLALIGLIIVALVLRRVVRLAGADAIDAHWVGSPAGLAAVKRLAGLDYAG